MSRSVPVEGPRRLSLRKAALRLGISEKQLRNACLAGRLPHYRYATGPERKRGRIAIDLEVVERLEREAAVPESSNGIPASETIRRARESNRKAKKSSKR